MRSNKQEIPNPPLDEEAELILTASRSMLDSGIAKQALYAVTEVYINYIHNEHGALPVHFEEIACSMIFLINFLKDMADIEEQRNSTNENAITEKALDDSFTSLNSSEEANNSLLGKN